MAENDDMSMDTSDVGVTNQTLNLKPAPGSLAESSSSDTVPVVQTQPQAISNQLINDMEKGDLPMDHDMLMPSAPPLPMSDDQTGGVVHAKVDCQWKDEKSKPKPVLQKALQSWFNNNTDIYFKATSCTVKSLSANGRALILIKPASVIEKLLQLGGTELTTKDGQTATIWFSSKPVPEPGTPTPDSNLMDAPSTLPPAAQDAEIPMEGWSGGAATAGQERGSFSVPLGLFWYINQAYKEKMKCIAIENGVQIKAEVHVSIEVDQKAGTPDLSKARREFEDLVQSCLGVYDTCTFQLKNADPGDWTATLKTLQREDAKVALTASSEECTVWGPRESLAALPKSLTITQNTPGNADLSPSASAWGSPDTSQKIGLNIKDPLVSDGITMDEIHWKLMTSSLDKKVTNIEDKFGVKFEWEISQRRVEVRAKSTNDVAAALKSHALRALLKLYQKVATSTMSCTLMAPDRAKEVEDKLKEMSPLYPVIGTGDNYSSWRLIGLPENMGPVVNELEKLVGPVFKEEDKQRIGYSKYNIQSVGAGAASTGGGATGGATGENSEEKCPICIDTFTDKEKLKCGHEFCKECLKSSWDKMGAICPVCKAVFGKLEGDQPKGQMSWINTSHSLPGFKGCGTIIIDYSIPSGVQTEKHPTPGKPYYSMQRTAYLPDNNEGREVLKLLKRAFDQKLIFTVGTSRTTGAEDVVTWNDIHHKTNTNGGPQSFGYPDPDYLSRVKDELKAKGIE